MPTSTELNLEPYGIRHVLKKGGRSNMVFSAIHLKQGSFSKSQGRFDLPSGTYSLGPELGRGSYGATFQAVNTYTNHVYAIKVIDAQKFGVDNAVKESIINIILEKESEHEVDGPYVPRFYEMAYDPVRQYILMRIERLQGMLSDVYYVATPQQNDLYVPETVGTLAHVLNFFYKRLHYNHRDLHTNNVGYMLDVRGKHKIKIIDFGFSCLTWNGIQMSGASYFSARDKCYIPSRDLSFFIYDLVIHMSRLFSHQLLTLLKTLITFPLDKSLCKLFEGCSYNGVTLKKDNWHGVYAFLNNQKVKNPHAEPRALYKRMLEFLGQTIPKDTTPVTIEELRGPIKHCLPEQILNPKTRRCVRRSGKVGREIMRDVERRTPSPTRLLTNVTRKAFAKNEKPCEPGKTRNPVTRRCRYACSPTQIRNPTTGRCISRYGAMGRQLKAQGVKTSLQY